VFSLPSSSNMDGANTLGYEGTNTHQFSIQSAYVQTGNIQATKGN